MSVYTAIRASKIVFWYPRHKISAFENFWKFSIFFQFFSIFCFFLQKYPQMRFFKIYPNFVKSQNVKVLSYKYDIGTYWYLMFVSFLAAYMLGCLKISMCTQKAREKKIFFRKFPFFPKISNFFKIFKFFSVPFGCTYFQKISKQKNRYQGLSFYGTSV